MKLSVIVLAAGLGTRMKSQVPKMLHPLAGEPMLKHVLRAAEALKPERLVVVVGHEGKKIKEAIGNRYDYVEQGGPRGTGHAVLTARRRMEGRSDTVLVLYGDHPLTTPETFREVISEHHKRNATSTFLAFQPPDPTGYGRVLRDARGEVRAIVEEAAASSEEKQIGEAVSGVLVFRDSWLWPNLEKVRPNPKKGEIFLTDLISMALAQGETVVAPQANDDLEAMGINDRAELAQAEAVMRQRALNRLMQEGVTIVDPASTFVDFAVKIGQDTVIFPWTVIQGQTRIGTGCRIGPQARIVNSKIGNGCIIESSTVEGAQLKDEVHVGPYSHLRPGARLGRGVHIGDYVEVKESRVGEGTHIGHFSYIGDATIGAQVNIGAGTVTCNFDGVKKNRTIIGDHAFIGSDTMLVAPLRVGQGAKTGAGSVVTHNLPPGSLAYGVPAQVVNKKKSK